MNRIMKIMTDIFLQYLIFAKLKEKNRMKLNMEKFMCILLKYKNISGLRWMKKLNV